MPSGVPAKVRVVHDIVGIVANKPGGDPSEPVADRTELVVIRGTF
jgi:hypothetical protein